MESKLNVKKAATFDSTLYVNETTQLKGGVLLNDKLEVVQARRLNLPYVGNTATFNGTVSLKDTLDIEKAVTLIH